VVGETGTGIDLLAVGTGCFRQVLQGFVWPPNGGFYDEGEQIRDKNGDLWICVGAGTPGNWAKVAAPQFGYAGGALNLLATPIRLLDTRATAPPGSANTMTFAPIVYHGTVTFPAGGVTFAGQTIPAGATAVFGLLTAALAPGVNPGDGSSLIAYATGSPRPAAVNVVYNPQDLNGAYTSDFTLVRTGTGTGNAGKVTLYSQPIKTGVSVDAIFDCFGFVM
jgi:hypothetical protein